MVYRVSQKYWYVFMFRLGDSQPKDILQVLSLPSPCGKETTVELHSKQLFAHTRRLDTHLLFASNHHTIGECWLLFWAS